MRRYLISFPSDAMDSIPEEELSDVEAAAHAVVDEANGDGTGTPAAYHQTKDFHGGLTIVEVPSREVAPEWAAKIAAACRCTQEFREFGYDPRG